MTWRRKQKRPSSEGVFEFRRPSVASALGIDLEDPPTIPPYRVGSEPVTRRERGARRHPPRYRKAPEVDELLEEFVADAEAGVPDEWLGRRVGLSRDQVARWRKRRGIERTPGRPSAQVQLSAMAVDIFGRAPKPLVIPIDSPVGGRWEPPRYLLRQPLDYRRFAELVYGLVEQGHAPSAIAEGLGLRPRDVDDACRLWAARKRATA